MARDDKRADAELDECEPWDIGESHQRLAASPGGYEEEEVHGRANIEEENRPRQRPFDAPRPEPD